MNTAACTHRRTEIQRSGIPAPHFARRVCLDCGKHLAWVRGPMTPGRAAAFRLGFGKHKGKTLLAIDAAGDRAYLEWVADTWESHPGIVGFR
jgi:hypothetical protein